jgi:hypothetical protein
MDAPSPQAKSAGPDHSPRADDCHDEWQGKLPMMLARHGKPGSS